MRHLDPVDLFLCFSALLAAAFGGWMLYEWAVEDDPFAGFWLMFSAVWEYFAVNLFLRLREENERRRFLADLRS
jgi:hypothetical protein